MTTPNVPISLLDVRTEFGGAAPDSLSEYYRGGGLVPAGMAAGAAGYQVATSGAIDLNSFRTVTNRGRVDFTFSSNTVNAAINVATASAQSAQSRTGSYIAGNTDIVITINSGVYVFSDSVAQAGLSLSGGSAGDTVTVVNNGFIVGMGGVGGLGGAGPGVGGTALSLGFAATVNNTNGAAYIGGGGGGGGGTSGSTNSSGGGGAGGGKGGNTSGGAGGGAGASGANGTGSAGGGGGRVFSGTGGAARTLTGVTNTTQNYPGNGGGAGGGGGGIVIDTNGKGAFNTYSGGGGGGYGASGGLGRYAASAGVTSGAGGSANGAGGNTTGGSGTSSTQNGAAGGKAVALNGFGITWVSGNTTRVYGAVS